jgi:sarcosine oxidase subunit gamma
MAEITANHPLDGLSYRSEDDGRLALAPLPFQSRLNLRLDEADAAALGDLSGVPLPGRIGDTALEGERRAMKLGPDFAAAVEAALAEVTHSLVEMSDRDIAIEISGLAASEVLAAGCPLDLSAMPAGRCTRTVFDKAEVVIFKSEQHRYAMAFWRSFAPHVWGLLAKTAREIEADLR